MKNSLRCLFYKATSISFLTSVISYLTNIFLAQICQQETVANCLYLTTCALALGLIIDFGSEQSMTHYAKYKQVNIFECWQGFALNKITIVGLLGVSSIAIEFFFDFDLPQSLIILMVPAFYLGSVFEAFGKNIEYAAIILIEKIIFLMVLGFESVDGLSVHKFCFSYFFVTLGSLLIQIIFAISFLGSIINRDFRIRFSLATFIKLYYPVYVISLCQMVYGNISRIIIESRYGVITFASITFAFQFINSITIAQSQIDRQLRPLLIIAVKEREHQKVRELLSFYVKDYILPVCFLAILVALASDLLSGYLYGKQWLMVGRFLRYASPLMITIGLMRLIDMLSIAINKTNANMTVNILAIAALLALMIAMPKNDPVYIIIGILAIQIVHIFGMAAYIYKGVFNGVIRV